MYTTLCCSIKCSLYIPGFIWPDLHFQNVCVCVCVFNNISPKLLLVSHPVIWFSMVIISIILHLTMRLELLKALLWGRELRAVIRRLQVNSFWIWASSGHLTLANCIISGSDLVTRLKNKTFWKHIYRYILWIRKMIWEIQIRTSFLLYQFRDVSKGTYIVIIFLYPWFEKEIENFTL